MDFIDERIDDRIGLVIFASESFTQCPITIDHDVLKNLFTSIKPDLLEDGTAIGMGLATSISRLKDSKAKSKVIILLTDGMNNRGFIAPLTAAEIAKSYGIRVYSIGVGTVGMAPYPFKTPFGTQYQNVEVKIDEDVLKNIAGLTGGKYFRATSNKVLKNVYQEIDKLEKTRVDVSIFSRRSEEFLPYAIGAALLFILEIFLRYTVFRKVP
jgi:Ca-activated chloride channel family protein